ncbi:MAG: ABC transporter permease, partial [Bacteroidota bacterium]
MLRNYLLTATRFFWRHKGYTFLNILGLTVGMTTAILILLWIQDELKIDQTHPHPDQLYNTQLNDYFSGGNTVTGDALPYPVGEVLINEYPEVKEVCFYSWQEEMLVSIEEQKIYRETGRYSNPNLIPLLGFKLMVGHPRDLLQTPHSIAISSE